MPSVASLVATAGSDARKIPHGTPAERISPEMQYATSEYRTQSKQPSHHLHRTNCPEIPRTKPGRTERSATKHHRRTTSAFRRLTHETTKRENGPAGLLTRSHPDTFPTRGSVVKTFGTSRNLQLRDSPGLAPGSLFIPYPEETRVSGNRSEGKYKDFFHIPNLRRIFPSGRTGPKRKNTKGVRTCRTPFFPSGEVAKITRSS